MAVAVGLTRPKHQANTNPTSPRVNKACFRLSPLFLASFSGTKATKAITRCSLASLLDPQPSARYEACEGLRGLARLVSRFWGVVSCLPSPLASLMSHWTRVLTIQFITAPCRYSTLTTNCRYKLTIDSTKHHQQQY